MGSYIASKYKGQKTRVKDYAYAFAAEVDRQIESLSRDGFFFRSGRGKKLLEEILPISRLAVSMKLPGSEVEVEAFEGDGPTDGRISVSGFVEDIFNVQVTCVYSYEESLRDELLLKQGVSPAFGHIYRDNKSREIIAETEATDNEEFIMTLSRAVMERFRRKVEKGATPNTDLLIAFNEVTLYGRSAWDRLFGAIADLGGLAEGGFRRVFILNCANNQLYRAA
jgi:hypothetical protein